jgi:DNA-binding transcriptional ArsR family regulator
VVLPSEFVYIEEMKKASSKPKTLPGETDPCEEYLKALADSSRLRVMRALVGTEWTVSDLAILLETEIANVSHHLRVLFKAGMVKTRRDGRHIYYRLNEELSSGQRSKVEKLDFGCCRFELT